MLDVGQAFLDDTVVHNEIFESLSVCILLNGLSDDAETIQVNLLILSVLLIISVKYRGAENYKTNMNNYWIMGRDNGQVSHPDPRDSDITRMDIIMSGCIWVALWADRVIWGDLCPGVSKTT